MKKKTLLIVLVAAIFVVMVSLTNSVKAADSTYGKVDVIKNADAQSEGTVDPNGGEAANVTVKVTKTSLKWVEKDTNAGRNSDGYWIGIKVTAPKDVDVDKSTMTRRAGEGETADKDGNVTKSFKTIRDSKEGDPTQYTELWVRVNENLLDEEEVDLMNYKFSWVTKTTGEETTTVQNIKFKLVTDQVTLDKGDNAVTVTVEGKKFTLTKGKTLKDLTAKEKAVLAELKKAPKGKVYVSLVDKEGKEFKENTPITEDIELTVKFKNAPVVAEEDEKDDTANTGIENVYAVAGLVAVIALAGAIVLNKRK